MVLITTPLNRHQAFPKQPPGHVPGACDRAGPDTSVTLGTRHSLTVQNSVVEYSVEVQVFFPPKLVRGGKDSCHLQNNWGKGIESDTTSKAVSQPWGADVGSGTVSDGN